MDAKVTASNIATVLANDHAVKLAGCDVDGVLRGKLMATSKLLSLVKRASASPPQFGFCSVIFGWDMHDQTYVRELRISNKENGYRDIVARIDLSSFRRIPWEDNVPFFLVDFVDPDTGQSLSACPRSLLKRTVEKLSAQGLSAMAGGWFNSWFYTF